MGRYLLFMSYIGTQFSGMQRQGTKPIKTVVGVLEEALKQLRCSNVAHAVSSSRTDRGVHALCNTVHTDLQRSNGGDFDVDYVTSTLNETFRIMQQEIRVLKTLRVSDNFHSRYQAKQRTYVYRVCTSRNPLPNGRAIPYPLFEYNRSFLLRRPLNIDLVREAAETLRGVHDFTLFTNPSVLVARPECPAVRRVDIHVERGTSFLAGSTSEHCGDFQHWNLVFKAHSFLFRQVRKMTGVMLAAGLGDMELDDVRRMVDSPAETVVRKQNIFDVPAYALYLTDVEYNSDDLIFKPVSTTDEECCATPHPVSSSSLPASATDDDGLMELDDTDSEFIPNKTDATNIRQ